MPEPAIYSVSEITRTIKLLLEEQIPMVWIEGEVSNFKAHFSGHYYFTLKDSGAQLSAVIWKSRLDRLKVIPEDGMLVQALGNIRLFEKSGRYQLDIITLQQSGLGNLQAEFERLKQRLLEEGLFDPDHKKPIPPYARRIGVVTSPTGAAIRDIIQILNRRAPHIDIIVRPVKVQGEGAAADIARAIEDFNRYGQVDVLIVGRGGGSLEDLWPFNEEPVARAIFNSRLPVISAVGHEIDYTIADFVADLRAPTPSAAAELAVPDYREIRYQLAASQDRLKQLVLNKISFYRDRLQSYRKSYALRRPLDLIKQYAQQVDHLANRLSLANRRDLGERRKMIESLRFRLNGLNPVNVLQRGYSITSRKGQILRDAAEVQKGEKIHTRLHKGAIESTIDDLKEK